MSDLILKAKSDGVHVSYDACCFSFLAVKVMTSIMGFAVFLWVGNMV